MDVRSAVILAAGKGTRMKSKLPKVLHEVLGKSMLLHVIHSLKQAQITKIVVVLGHESALVEESLKDEPNVEFVYQNEQLGTAHALLQAQNLLEHEKGNTIVVCGDTPLLTVATIEEMFTQQELEQAACTILTGVTADATGYGRIIRNSAGLVQRIVEEKDATDIEKQVTEFNSGTYCFANDKLYNYLSDISNDNAQSEYYLPDIVDIYVTLGKKVTAHIITDQDEIIGVNDRVALSVVEEILRKRINHFWQINGVTIINPSSTYIGSDVEIGTDVIIEPNVQLLGKTIIGSGAQIGMNSQIINSSIGEETIIKQSVITDSKIGANGTVGPFAHLRLNCDVADSVRIGNFVEFKNTTFGTKSSAAHLSYVGDAEVGKRVNFGCGTITVNYDGVKKSKTIVQDDVFIGCNSNLIAPITLEDNSFIAAGTTVTHTVPKDALAIGRTKQSNKNNYATVFKKRK
jgi:UDP-N-acetylglucosamine diphosphorylase/glucosamine-1-phosphate N-acetyltransferase